MHADKKLEMTDDLGIEIFYMFKKVGIWNVGGGLILKHHDIIMRLFTSKFSTTISKVIIIRP
jgi:hypothetical protein